MLTLMTLALMGCSHELPSPSKKTTTTKTKVEKPTITVSTAVTSDTDFTVVFKVTSQEDPTVTLHYGTTSSCSKSSTCYLYNSGSSKTRFYKASHTGFAKGAKIYFYGEATNSGGTAKTSVDYRITKR